MQQMRVPGAFWAGPGGPPLPAQKGQVVVLVGVGVLWMSVISYCVERAKKVVVGVEKVPLQSIDFIRYSGWLTCGIDLWDPLGSKHPPRDPFHCGMLWEGSLFC